MNFIGYNILNVFENIVKELLLFLLIIRYWIIQILTTWACKYILACVKRSKMLHENFATLHYLFFNRCKFKRYNFSSNIQCLTLVNNTQNRTQDVTQLSFSAWFSLQIEACIRSNASPPPLPSLLWRKFLNYRNLQL